VARPGGVGRVRTTRPRLAPDRAVELGQGQRPGSVAAAGDQDQPVGHERRALAGPDRAHRAGGGDPDPGRRAPFLPRGVCEAQSYASAITPIEIRKPARRCSGGIRVP
jgi:hypothetical protein